MIKKITAITLLSAVLFSCSTSNEVVSNGFFQKRKYNKGWYANKSSKVKSSKENNNSKDVHETKEEANNAVVEELTIQQEVKAVSKEYISKSDLIVKPTKTVLASNNDKEEVISSTSKIIVQEQETAVLENLKRVSDAKPVEINDFSSKNSNESGIALLLLVIIAILLPPLAVALVDGLSGRFWICLLLTLLFYLPGLIYALFVLF